MNIQFFSPSHNQGPLLVRAMRDWPDAWDEELKRLMPTMTNHSIAKLLGATPGLVGFRIKKVGLTRTPEQNQALYSTIEGRLKAGVNEVNQQPAGTCKWIKKHKNRPNEKPEWWIFLGKGERMPLRRYLWQTWIGPIPKGYNVCFVDNNSKRCLLSNLICIPNSEMAHRNRNGIKIGVTMRAFWKTPEGKLTQRKRSKALLAFWRSPEGKARIAQRSEKISQMNAEDKIDNPFRRLHDSIVAYYLSQDPETQQYILENQPELIELKRTELLLKRAIKQQKGHDE